MSLWVKMMWNGKYIVEYNKKVLKEITKLKENKLSEKLKKLIDIIKINPYQNPPPYEKLVGDLKDYYSRRINVQHRMIYQVFEEEKRIRILSVYGRIMKMYKKPNKHL